MGLKRIPSAKEIVLYVSHYNLQAIGTLTMFKQCQEFPGFEYANTYY